MAVSSYKLGILAEWLVMVRYTLHFYRLLDYRMRNKNGEIDIICSRGKLIVFIEVKARRSAFDNDVICSQHQIARIKRAAELYIYQHKYYDFDARFDLAVVRPWQLPLIIENAW